MIITFNTPVNIVLRPQSTIPEISENISEMKILEMIDNPVDKKVIVRLKGVGNFRFNKYVTLWEGAEYDAIGQWTDTDVANKVKEIYGDV